MDKLGKLSKEKSHIYTREKVKKQALTKETHEALVLSRSLISCVKCLLNNDFFFVSVFKRQSRGTFLSDKADGRRQF